MGPSKHKQWENLFQTFARRHEDKSRRAHEQRELVAWYDEQTTLVMTLVREVALERAELFAASTNGKIDVRWPSRPPINVDPEGPFMSFMALAMESRAMASHAIESREVHLYSHRLATGAPLIHYVVTGDGYATRQRKRVHGRPGCRIERRAGGGFLLRDVAQGAPEGSAELSVEDLAYRAFELLLSVD